MSIKERKRKTGKERNKQTNKICMFPWIFIKKLVMNVNKTLRNTKRSFSLQICGRPLRVFTDCMITTVSYMITIT